MKNNRFLSLLISGLQAIFNIKLFFSRLLLSTIFLFLVFISNAQEKAKPADSFVETIGVGDRFDWLNNSGRLPQAQKALKSLKIRYIRTGISSEGGNPNTYIDAVKNMASASGAKVCATADTWNSWSNLSTWLDRWGTALNAVEGQNEFSGSNSSNWTNADQLQQSIYSYGNSHLLEVYSWCTGGPAWSITGGYTSATGQNSHYVNFHPYHWYTDPSKRWATKMNGLWQNCEGGPGLIAAARNKIGDQSKPFVTTEFGWCIDLQSSEYPVDVKYVKKYLPRNLFENFNSGMHRGYIFSLTEYGGAGADYGLANSKDGSLRAHGQAVANIITLLEEPGKANFVTTNLNYSLSNLSGVSGHPALSFTDDHNMLNDEIHHTLLQKSDSTFYLILFCDYDSHKGEDGWSQNATLNLPDGAQNVRVYLPVTNGTSIVKDYGTVVIGGSVSLNSTLGTAIPDHPLVIEIISKPATIPITDVQIISDLSTVKVGRSLTLTANILPENASIKRINWSSSDLSIASVGYDGIVMGQSAGNATIFAKTYDGNFEASLSIKVEEIPVESVNLISTLDKIILNDSLRLNYSIIPLDATNKTVSWSSSNPEVATVSASGVVTGKTIGNATITVTTQDGGKTANYAISVTSLIVTDYYNKWRKIYYKSANIVIDSDRVSRGSNTTENIIYNYGGITDFNLKVFDHEKANLGKVKVYTSPDDITYNLISTSNTTPLAITNGLSGNYFNNLTLTGSASVRRIDPTVNFDWGSGTYASGHNTDGFSVRWTGQVQAQYSETYTFYVNTDDGVRLWVNGIQLVNDWVDRLAEKKGTISLTAGQKYSITLEYYENKGFATAQLSWSSPSTNKTIIPQSQLYSDKTPDVTNGIWYKSYYTPASAIPSGTNYLKIEIGSGTTFSWTPQISESMIYYSIPITIINPDIVTGIMVKALNANQVVLDWNKATNVLGYSIWRKTGLTGTWSELTIIENGSVITYTDSTVTASTKYSYKIVAFNSICNAPASTLVSVTTPNGINSILTNTFSDVIIYPNPYLGGLLTIKLNTISNWKIEIRELSGRQIYSYDFYGTEFKIKNLRLNSGLYLVNLRSNLFVKEMKLIVK